MQLKKNAITLLKSLIFIFPIQIFFLFFIIQVNTNFFYEESYGTIYRTSLIISGFLFFCAYVLFGFFLDTMRNKIRKLVIIYGGILAIIACLVYYGVSLKFNDIQSLSEIINYFISSVFSSFGLIFCLMLFAGLLVAAFVGIYAGAYFREYFGWEKNKLK